MYLIFSRGSFGSWFLLYFFLLCFLFLDFRFIDSLSEECSSLEISVKLLFVGSLLFIFWISFNTCSNLLSLLFCKSLKAFWIESNLECIFSFSILILFISFFISFLKLLNCSTVTKELLFFLGFSYLTF